MIEDVISFLQPTQSTLSHDSINSPSLAKCKQQLQQKSCTSDTSLSSSVPQLLQTPVHHQNHPHCSTNEKTVTCTNKSTTAFLKQSLQKRSRDSNECTNNSNRTRTDSSDDEAVIVSRQHCNKSRWKHPRKVTKAERPKLLPKKLFPDKELAIANDNNSGQSGLSDRKKCKVGLDREGENIDRDRGWKRSWNLNHFCLKKKIGSGSFGTVFSGFNTESKEKVALKQLGIKQNESHMKLIHREIEIHTGLVHNHILRTHGYFQDDEHLYLVLELGKMDLFRHLYFNKKCNSGKLSLIKAANIIAQITCAIVYLNKHSISHRDIKPENILLQKGGIYKLADFGWAVQAPPPNHHMRRTLCGSPEFVPPEMVEMKHHNHTKPESEYDARYVDPWALGVLSHELVLQRTPFYMSKDDSESLVSLKGYKNRYEALMEEKIRPFVCLDPCEENVYQGHREFYDFCERLMRRIPSSRMTAADALRHPWLLTCKQTLLEEDRTAQIVTPNPTNKSK